MKLIVTNKIFRNLTISSLISNLGMVMYQLAIVSYASTLNNSTLAISIISFASYFAITLQAFTGVIADNTFNKTKLMIISNLIQASIFLSIGFLIQSGANIYFVIVITAMNFIATVLGLYRTGLSLPIIVTIVKKEDMSEATGIIQGSQSIISIFGSSIGGSLLIIMPYQHIAWLNSFMFLISALILFIIFKGNKEVFKEFSDKNTKLDNNINNKEVAKQKINLLKSVYNNIKLVLSHKDLKLLIIVFAIINSVASVSVSILDIIVALHKSTVIFNFSTTVAIHSIAMAISGIIGSLIGVNILKNISFKTIILLAIIGMIILIVLNMLLNNQVILFNNIMLESPWLNKNNILTHIIIIDISIILFLSASIFPRFFTYTISLVDKEQLSSFTGALSSLLTISIPVGIALILGTANIFNINYALLVCAVLVLITLIIAIKIKINKSF